jgi:ligand-binding SRPBCC domain-containing protein
MFSGEFIYKTRLPIKKEVAWNFFNDISNLVRITTFPKITIVSHTGTKKGSVTELDLNFFLFRKKWKLTYIDVEEGDFFTDRSDTVPFPFKSWEHTHSFEEIDEETLMVDKVKFESYIPISIAKIGLTILFKGRQQSLKKHLPI